RLEISSRNPDASAAIIAHFDGADWLEVMSDGIGAWTGPRGTLVMHVVTPAGEPVEDAMCTIDPDDPAAQYDNGDVGMATRPDGLCRFEQIGATWFDAIAWLDVQNVRLEGHTRVLVIADKVTEVHVVI